MYPLVPKLIEAGDRGEGVPSVFDHPGHFFCRTLRGGDDQVTLVLPVLVVHYDEELASREGGQCVFHSVELEAGPWGSIADFCRTPERF